MKLFEGIEDYGHQMHLAIKAMLKDVLQMDIEDAKARELTDKLALSDILALDTALDNQNGDAIRDIIGKHISLEEYSLPGRSNIQSAASSRNERDRKTQATTTTQPTKPVAGGNKVATGGAPKAATGGADEIDDNKQDRELDQAIQDREKELADLKKKAGLK